MELATSILKSTAAAAGLHVSNTMFVVFVVLLFSKSGALVFTWK